jgi:hypothetical protein
MPAAVKKQTLCLIILLGLTVARVGAQQGIDPARTKNIWQGNYEETEELLRTAEIMEIEDVGMGVTSPHRVTLNKDGRTFGAVFKPIKRGRHSGYWESYQAEIAAYRLDKLLGLGMVPPTIERRVDGNLGSLQLWIENSKLYRDVQGETPRTPEWSYQLSRMKMFDVLINNIDRNAQNFLVDTHHRIFLIDHSRAFTSGRKMLKDEDNLPNYFDRRLVEKMKSLTREELDADLDDLLMGSQVRDILKRRNALLEHLEKLIAERGQGQVLF